MAARVVNAVGAIVPALGVGVESVFSAARFAGGRFKFKTFGAESAHADAASKLAIEAMRQRLIFIFSPAGLQGFGQASPHVVSTGDVAEFYARHR